MQCPYCKHTSSNVIDTNHDAKGGIRRRRVCNGCTERFSTYERAILATPLIVKKSGTRDEFDRDKLLRGLRIACAKRPVAASAIENIVDEVEAKLQSMGKSEVASRIVGDMVLERLKALDQVAYIRYAIVYLKLDDLSSIQSEINELLT